MIEALEARLAELAAQGETINYGALAIELGLNGPGRIVRLTTALETLMEQDAAQGRPLRAALVVGRLSSGLPARGFYDKAVELGYDTRDPVAFHKAQVSDCLVHAQRGTV